MWELLHKLFGWDYVLFDYGWHHYIRRIRYTPNGLEYIRCYGMHFLSDKSRNYKHLTRKPQEASE